MKPLNHKLVKTAERRLRGSQPWLEGFWSQSMEALEPSRFGLTIYWTADLGLTICLSLNTHFNILVAQVSSLIVPESSLKDNLNSVVCLTPQKETDCVCAFIGPSWTLVWAVFEHVMFCYKELGVSQNWPGLVFLGWKRLQEWNQWPNSAYYSHDCCCNSVEMGTSHVDPFYTPGLGSQL